MMNSVPVPAEIVDAPVIPDLYRFAIDAGRFPCGLHMEFGVASGNSLRKIRKLLHPDVCLYGFDSFEGLPQPWNGLPQGTFATDLRVDLVNTELVVGPYDRTLEAFAANHRGPVNFMHIDCDLYTSTMAVLTAFRHHLIRGSIILFDELFGFAGYEAYEYRALRESGIRFEAIGRWNAFRAAVRVK